MSSDTGDRRDRGFNPKMGRRPAEPRPRPTLQRAVLLGFARGFGGGGRTLTPSSSRASRDRCATRVSAAARRCVVKARYVSMAHSGAKAARAHLAYVERDGVEKDGSQGRLFGPDGDVRRGEFAQAIPGEKRQFRFIIAPEDGHELDLRQYTRDLVERMEKDLGRGLRWAAVCHYNTDNPHVHLVVRGVDQDGRDVRIDRTYLSRSLRQRAQELATRELGPREERDVRRQLDREVSGERFTNIDRQLGALATPERTIRLADIAAAADARRISRPHAIARLDVLASLQLAERISTKEWRLEEGWEQTLQQLGERGDIIKTMHRAMREQAVEYRIFDPIASAPIQGVVRHKGLHDEQAGTPFMIVETARKEAHYVRLDAIDSQQVKVGERVRALAIPGKWVTAPDHAIARLAASTRGYYEVSLHQQQLLLRPVVIEGRHIPAEEIIAATVRRLERLERYKLVERVSDQVWRIPPNLVDVLRDRERTHPRPRIEIERLDQPLAPHLSRGRNRGPDRGM